MFFVQVRSTESEEKCREELIPTPKTVCWEEEVEVCTEMPELVEKPEHINKCAPAVSDDECAKVRLSIPTEICTYVQSYVPYYPPSPYSH